MIESSNRAVRLANELREHIRHGKYVPAQAIPSERELSQSTRLSRTTVRRAIQMLVEEGVLLRVPGSGTYVGRVRSVNAVQPTLGLLAPAFINPYYGELADSIEQEANARDYQLLVGRTNYSSSNEASYLLRYADNPAVKGMLVVPTYQDAPIAAYQHLQQRGIPFIFVSRTQDNVPGDAVTSDRVGGARALTHYLLSLGHRRIAYVRGTPPNIDSHLVGYQQALEQAGVPVDPDLFVSLEGGHEEAGRDGARLLLERGLEFTAIFARNDLTAVGVLQTLTRAGLRVPEDVSLVGFDNTQLSAHLQPSLTTVDNTLSEIGRLAVSLLLDRIEGRYSGPGRHVIIEPNVILRDSCAAPTTRVFTPALALSDSA